MTDIIQDVRDYFADRFSSPLWLSIIVSWLLINWQLPVTAIFETSRFNVGYIRFYIESTDHWCLATIPLIVGLSYSILSRSLKETLELTSKTIRNLIAQIDRKGIFYKSISIADHEEQLSKLKRQLKRIETDKEQLHDVILENTKLTEEKNSLTSKLTQDTLKSEKLESEHEETERSNKLLINQIAIKDEKIKILENESIDLKEKSVTQVENLKSSKSQINILHAKLLKTEERIKLLTKDNGDIKSIIKILKKHIFLNIEENPSITEKLINDLEKIGIKLIDTNTSMLTLKNSYYETILENSDPTLKDDLKNPHSSASIFLLLEFFSKTTVYNSHNIKETLGLPDHHYEKILKTVSDAQWITLDPIKRYILSTSGKEKLNQLLQSDSLSKLKFIIAEINKETEKHIISTLMENHLSMDTLQQKVSFNYSIINAINNLKNNGKIVQSGKVFSIKNK